MAHPGGHLEDDAAEDQVDVQMLDLDEAEEEEFFLPSVKSDLISKNDDPFTFRDRLTWDECLEALGHEFEWKHAMRQEGIHFLRENFQAVCSTIWHFGTMDDKFLTDFLKGLIAAVNLAGDQLSQILGSPATQKKTFRSAFKLCVYLLGQYGEALQKLIMENTDNTKKGGVKSRNQAPPAFLKLRCDTLMALESATYRKTFCKLWDTGTPEREFRICLLNSLSRYCSDYDLICHKTEAASGGALVKAVGNVLLMGEVAEEFWKAMMNLFRRNDCGNFAGEVVGYAYRVRGMDIMDEAFRALDKQMDDITASAAESSMGMSYANLLKSLAESHPVAAASCTDELEELLKCDSASVRSACVQLLGSAIRKQKEEPIDQLDPRCVHAWWRMFLAQIKDSNSNVRNRVLTCLLELSSRGVISKNRYPAVVKTVIGRVGTKDHTPTTRNKALVCLTELLERRPDLLQRTLTDMHVDYCAHVDKLFGELEAGVADDFMKSWLAQRNVFELQAQVAEAAVFFSKTREIRSDVCEAVKGQDYKRVWPKLCDAVDSQDGPTAFHYLMAIAKKFPEERIVEDYGLQAFLGEHGNDIPAHRLLDLSDCILYIVNLNPETRTKLEGVNAFLQSCGNSKTNERLRQMAVTVSHSWNDIEIRRLLTECIPGLEKTLQMAVVADIIEISNFLIFAESKKFKEGVPVLRRLPSFFTSEKREVIKAASEAYRKFFIGSNTTDAGNRVDDLVVRLLHELPCISAPHAGSVRVMFREEEPLVMRALAKKLVGIATNSDTLDDVWRACLAVSVLPASADTEIIPQLERLQKRCLNSDNYDPRLVCTFCDVLIKLGRSPLDKENISERDCKKMALPAHHPLLSSFFDICIICFTDERGRGQTQMLGKIAEALFAISEKPIDTLRALIHFVLLRLKICRTLLSEKTAAGEGEVIAGDTAAQATGPTGVPLQGMHFVLYFGATSVFTFANWVEDVFSINVESKENEEKRPTGDVDENEPDGPSEEDRGKALVVQLRKSLFEGENSGIVVIEKMIELLTADVTLHGQSVSLVAFMALIRLMLIHETYCQRHLKKLLKVLETTESLALRKALLIGFSDIAVRFVNLVQPHTDVFTRQLSHADPTIRYHALMAFVRIIVNDLVKVREQHCDIAVMICDPDDEVASVTKGFFKDKVPPQGVMNIVSQMLNRDDLHKKLDAEKMQAVMRYLIELIGKNATQIDALVNFFFKALDTSQSVETRRTASYCLSLIAPNITEKLLLWIRESVFALKEATKDEITLEYLVKAFEALRRKLPEDKKHIAEEIMKKLGQLSRDDVPPDQQQASRTRPSATRGAVRGRGRGGSAAASSPQPSTSRGLPKAAPRSAKKPPRRGRDAESDSDAESSSSSDYVAPKRGKGGRGGRVQF
ncbi:putative Condensin complex subunit 1 [Hypsibius exemplaris]|uniref:Condensin complex subunit 1 n=1 Tax=Hypsibius exemplaris TaxID=2072580 RepID=A0A1W0WE43_HYPEX|nr:putative Condensin complex subunit 1 [Hypsibius exemplaris]